MELDCGFRETRDGPGGRGTRPAPQGVKDELTDKGEYTRAGPLSVEAKEFSLETVSKFWVTAGVGSDGRGGGAVSLLEEDVKR